MGTLHPRHDTPNGHPWICEPQAQIPSSAYLPVLPSEPQASGFPYHSILEECSLPQAYPLSACEPQASQQCSLFPPSLDSEPQALPSFPLPSGKPSPSPPTSTATEATLSAYSCNTRRGNSHAVASVAIFTQPQVSSIPCCHRPHCSDTPMEVLQWVLVTCLTVGIEGQPGPPRQAQPPPQLQARVVPKQPPSHPFQLGGWWGSSPAEYLLPGWFARREGDQWTFHREGRYGIESFFFTPCVIATVECIPHTHHLHATSHPIVEGLVSREGGVGLPLRAFENGHRTPQVGVL